MKKLIPSLNAIGELPINFTKRCLELVAFCAAMLIVYYIVLENRGTLSLRDIFGIRSAVEYLVASAVLCPSFGLLLDLAMKK